MRLLPTRTTKPSGAAGDGEPRAALRDRPWDVDGLFGRYGDAVLTYCYHRLGTWEESEDATQQVFLNAVAGADRFWPRDGGGDPVRSWLFAIAHHEVANRHRSRSRHPQAPLDAALDVADSGPSPEELAVAADHQGRVLRLISQLSPDQRRVVELRLAGLTDVEIAAVLGRSHGAVRATQCRALARLRALMGVVPGARGGDDA